MPRFGALQASAVWAATTRTLTDFSAEEIFDLPIFTEFYPDAAVSSAALANTFGSWTQLLADVGTGKRLVFLVLDFRSGLSTPWEVEIGEGASGSEAAVARACGRVDWHSSAGFKGIVVVPLWKSLTDNARISARAKDDSNAAVEYGVVLLVA